MDSLPYLLFSYDLPLDDGVARVFICVNLIDARCVGVAISDKGAIAHMEHLWDELHENERGYSCDDDNNNNDDDAEAFGNNYS